MSLHNDVQKSVRNNGKEKYPAGYFDSVESSIDCALFRFAVGRGWRC